MNPIILKGKYTTAIIMIDNVEAKCLEQIQTMIDNPAFDKPVVIMPDTHAGTGSVIGFTMPLSITIIPNIVGVDIGCGMLSLKFPGITHLTQELKETIDIAIREIIPTGCHTHKEPIVQTQDLLDLFIASQKTLDRFTRTYNNEFGTSYEPIEYSFDWLENFLNKVSTDMSYFKKSLGTLGGGNHFIEIGKSDIDDDHWLTVHTGSRNLGQKVAMYHQKVAFDNTYGEFAKNLRTPKKQLWKRLKSQTTHPGNKASKEQWQVYYTEIEQAKKYLAKCEKMKTEIGLESLSGQAAMDYFIDMIFAQNYAQLNRALISRLIIENALASESISTIVESVHNFVDFDDLVIRKGAIRSYEDELAVIPFNMEDGLLIVEGKSNPVWSNSAPHGAGRVLSRTQARKQLDLDTMKQGMKNAGVYSTCVCENTIDEAKAAYKPADVIEAAIQPTCEIVERVVPIINIKDTTTEAKNKKR